VNVRPPDAAEKRAVRVRRLPASDWLLLLLLMRAMRCDAIEEERRERRSEAKMDEIFAGYRSGLSPKRKNTKTTLEIVRLVLVMCER
jgi:hypothetical protein